MNRHSSPLTNVFLQITNLGIVYLAYLALIPAAIILFSFIVISAINITHGELNLEKIDFLLIWLGDTESGNLSFDEKDVISAFWKISVIFPLLALVFTKVWQFVFKKKFHISQKKKFLLGSAIITGLMLFTQLSAYLPTAAKGASELWWILLLFWLIAIIVFALYSMLMTFAGLLHTVAVTITSSAKTITIDPNQIKILRRFVPNFEDKIAKLHKISVETGQWEKIKKKMDPQDVKYIERYWADHEKGKNNN